MSGAPLIPTSSSDDPAGSEVVGRPSATAPVEPSESRALPSTASRRRAGWLELALAAVSLLVGGGALVWFFRDLETAELIRAAQSLEPSRIGFSALLSLLAIALLGMLDLVAALNLRPRRLPGRVAWWTGSKGFAVSNIAGFALVTGSMVRIPVYRRYEVGPAGTLGLMSLSWSAFWIASAATVATAVLADARWSGALRIGACFVLLATVVLLIWLGRRGRSLSFRGRTVRLPPARLALLQSATALAEIAVSALSLYVLFGAEASDVALFLAAYVLAVGVGLLSNVPGGLGTFEASFLGLSGMAPTATFAAAILVYRINRFVLPLLVVLPFLGWDTLGRFRDRTLAGSDRPASEG